MIAVPAASMSRRRATDRLATAVMAAAALAVIVPLVAILLFVFVKGLPALNLELFTDDPGPAGVPGGGIRNAIVGSAVLVGLALVLGLPVALATGVFLAEYGRQGSLGFTVRFLLDVLAGVPSITIGVFVYTAIVLNMGKFSAFAGGVALALILLPVVARVTEEMLLLVPESTREAAYALGVPKWRTIIGVILPAAASGITTGIILAAARIAGEAAPLLFTALGNNFYSTALSRPIDALPLRIFTYATGPFPYWHDQAWAGSFVLVMFVLVLSLAARALLRIRRPA
jgi:phosphate transport system permease protein